MMIEPRWMTVREVAEYLRVQTPHVYRLLREGRLPAVRVGRRAGIRIDGTKLDEVLEALTPRKSCSA